MEFSPISREREAYGKFNFCSIIMSDKQSESAWRWSCTQAQLVSSLASLVQITTSNLFLMKLDLKVQNAEWFPQTYSISDLNYIVFFCHMFSC